MHLTFTELGFLEQEKEKTKILIAHTHSNGIKRHAKTLA